MSIASYQSCQNWIYLREVDKTRRKRVMIDQHGERSVLSQFRASIGGLSFRMPVCEPAYGSREPEGRRRTDRKDRYRGNSFHRFVCRDMGNSSIQRELSPNLSGVFNTEYDRPGWRAPLTHDAVCTRIYRRFTAKKHGSGLTLRVWLVMHPALP
jgi:hypothetical protein